MHLNARALIGVTLVLATGLAACKKKEEPPPAPRRFGAAARDTSKGTQKAPPGQQKAQPGQQKAPPAGQQKAQPGQQKAPPAATPAVPVQGAPAAAGRPGAPAAQTAQARPDTSIDSAKIDYRREVYSYQGAARDPFTSLLTTSESQTTISDLRVVSIAYDPRGGRSVAVIRDRNRAGSPYRLRRGESIGRLRVIAIRQYEVVFQVEEFGFERQEVLVLQRPEVNR